MQWLLLLSLFVSSLASLDPSCPKLTRADCCRIDLDNRCFPRSCYKWINRYCPQRAEAILKRVNAAASTTVPSVEKEAEVRRSAPRRDLGKCGTVESNFQPCTTRGIADKLFKACCDLYVPSECHSLCTYETDQTTTRNMLMDIVRQKKCSMRHLSTILFCASQNRDNRKCCAALDLNAPQLQVGSRCLRMCDPSGTALERMTKEDVTCLYNWNVIMYCHHAGIREM